MADQLDGIDVALAAYRVDGEWVVDDVSDKFLVDVESLVAGLRRFPGDAALGLVVVEDDFFLLVRVTPGTVRLLVSDVTAADAWELAADAVEHLGLPMPEDDDDPVPAGDLGILADLGISAVEMAELIDDEEIFPDEALSEVAQQLGFGELYDEAAGFESA